MKALFPKMSAVLAVLVLLVSLSAPTLACGSTCCCQGKAATADIKPGGVLETSGCCGCAVGQQTEGQPAMPEYIVQHSDSPLTGFIPASAVAFNPAAFYPLTAMIRGSTARSSPPLYKLVSSYLC